MITKVEIVFENCEYLKLSSKDIKYLSLDDIQKYAYAYNLPHFDDKDKDTFSGFHSIESARTVYISLYKEALKNKKTIFGGQEESDAIERLKFGDITQIHIYDKDVKYWYIPWVKSKRGLRKHIQIPKPFAKTHHYGYSVEYKAENPKELGSPNIYQKFNEEKLSNYSEDEVITITINATEDLKKIDVLENSKNDDNIFQL